MGIQGLLQLLKPAHEDQHIKQYKGKTAVIDIMVWLYKGAFSCSFELATEQQTLAFLTYPIKMLKMLQSYHIKPICIFDGLHLKAKEDTEKLRSINKKKNKEMGYQMAEDGQEDEARKYFGRSLVLRSRMIDLFIDILQVLDIEYLIAPYEADAQMSYMVKVGLADFAISEDSDLIVYGCPLVALKLGLNGYLKSFSYQAFKEKKEIEQSGDKALIQIQKMNREQFVQICIMGGCEYLPSIQGVGLKVALKHFQKHSNIEDVLEALRKNKTFKDRISDEYIEKLKQVQQLFFYQTVYDPRNKKLVSLSVIPLDMEVDQEYLGPDIDEDVLPEYVNGLINKSTMLKRESYGGIIDFNKMLEDYRNNSINERSFVCLDPAFFGNHNKQEEGKEIRNDGGEPPKNFMETIEKMKKQRVREVMHVEDFGFCDNDEEQEDDQVDYMKAVQIEDKTVHEEEEQIKKQPVKQAVKNNKLVNNDLDMLSSLCSEQNHSLEAIANLEYVLNHQEAKSGNDKSPIVEKRRESSIIFNKKGKDQVEKENDSKLTTPFAKFSQVVKLDDDEDSKKGMLKQLFRNQSSSKSPEKAQKKDERNKKRKITEISNSKPNSKLDFFFQSAQKKSKVQDQE